MGQTAQRFGPFPPDEEMRGPGQQASSKDTADLASGTKAKSSPSTSITDDSNTPGRLQASSSL